MRPLIPDDVSATYGGDLGEIAADPWQIFSAFFCPISD